MFRKWKKGGHLDPYREKIKEELYAFKKTVEHGFPHHPSTLAFDPVLKLLAIGTKSGSIKVFGAPGVEFTGIHSDINQVLQLHFLNGEGRLISILDDNTMHMWELCTNKEDRNAAQSLIEVGGSKLSGRPGINQITEVAVKSSNDAMWVGTEGGAIYSLTLPEFESHGNGVIHQDQVMQSIPDEYKSGKALGPVEAIAEHPSNPSLILIGYSRGLVVLWDDTTQSVKKFYLNDKSLESVSWHSNGREFISAHIDGSLSTWRLDSCSPNTTYTPYGPFPCKAVTKIMWKSSRSDPYVIFSGGMPRANYGDRYCISVIHGSKHVTFDFTSRIIDTFVICKNVRCGEWEDPEYLVALAEEELIIIDLTEDDWPCVAPPCLASPHASAITCSAHAEDVSENVWEKINNAAKIFKAKSKLSSKWPFTGGVDLAKKSSQSRNLLITGHEDGSVKLWDVSGVAMAPLLKIQTTAVFITDSEDPDGENAFEEQFPPFRKVGEFDPYSDDPRLAIRKVTMCPFTGTIAAGGTAGQVMIITLSNDSIESLVTNNEIDILEGRTDFTWKGHDRLHVKEGHISMDPGYQIANVIQCQPPASVSSVSVHANWGLVGMGTGHGFALFDYLQNKLVLSRCTLESGDHASMEGNFSRVQSLKMSLRQSMRRIRGSFRSGGSKRKRSSGRRRYKRDNMSQKLQEANAALVEEEETASGSGWSPTTTGQRRVEPRSSEDGMTGMVRCTYFATTFIRDNVSSSPSFWAGTNSGGIYVFALHIPDYSMRQAQEVTSVVGKHIQLMHRAPVIDLTVVDGNGTPVQCTPSKPDGKPVNGGAVGKSAPHGSSHHHSLIISSEEQLKVFTLPKISAKRKFKLTAIDGSLVRRVIFSKFVSSKNPDYYEYSLVCLTNLGEIHILSQLPSLRPQETYSCIFREDAHALASSILTTQGQGFYLLSQSEYERFSVSASNVIEPSCCVTTTRSTQNDSASSLDKTMVHVVVEDAAPIPLDLQKKSPARSSRTSIGHAVVAMEPHSPKTPLLCDDDDDHTDDDDDERHMEKHESVLEEAERTLAEAGDDIVADNSGGEDVNIQELLGAVAEAERVLNEN